MKLRNKKTGEIVEAGLIYFEGQTKIHYSLAELNEEWEDYEEPKEHYFITECGEVYPTIEYDNEDTKLSKQIGNYFETKEEAEKAVEKLKAWKRLKDAGVSFKPTTIGHKWYLEPHASPENRTFKESQELFKDVMLFFGGENE